MCENVGAVEMVKTSLHVFNVPLTVFLICMTWTEFPGTDNGPGWPFFCWKFQSRGPKFSGPKFWWQYQCTALATMQLQQSWDVTFISWTRISTSLPVLAMRKELSICNHCKRIPTNPTMSWFSSVPIGKNTPFEKLKNVSSDAGIDGNKVNHGLHTTSTREMV